MCDKPFIILNIDQFKYLLHKKSDIINSKIKKYLGEFIERLK